MKKVTRLLVFSCMLLLSQAYSQSDSNQSIAIKRNKNASKNIEVEVVYSRKNNTTSTSDKTRYLIKRKKEAAALVAAKSKKKSKALTSKKENVKPISNTVYSFKNVDRIPLFLDCSPRNKKEEKKCFGLGISKHIQDNFLYPEEAIDEGIVGKVAIKFIIDKTGQVVNVNATDANYKKVLTDYTVELISKLPKFKPATKNGIAVPVYYEFHLDFSL